MVTSHTQYCLGGMACTISFWKDDCLSCYVFYVAFLWLGCFPDIKVAEVWRVDFEAWDLCFCLNCFEPETVERASLSQLLFSVIFCLAPKS